MAKLWNILAASVGGGIALGLGMRVGESLVPKNPDGLAAVTTDVEARLAALEQQAPLKHRQPPTVPESVPGLITELVEERLAGIEQKLRTEAEARQQETLDAFVQNVQTRVVSRLSALEQSVETQGTAIGELRQYSLQTERNIQRLLLGIEKIAALRATPEAINTGAADPEPAPTPDTGRRERWFK